MISVDFTSVIFLLSFLVFLFLLDLFFFKPVAASLKARESGVDQQKEDLDTIHDDIEARISELENDKTIIGAKQEANSIVAKARNEANKEKQKLVEKSSNDMSIRVEEMLNAVEDDREEIFRSSEKYISKLTDLMKGRLETMLKKRSENLKDNNPSLV